MWWQAEAVGRYGGVASPSMMRVGAGPVLCGVGFHTGRDVANALDADESSRLGSQVWHWAVSASTPDLFVNR